MHGLMHGEQKVATCKKICELCEEKFGDDDVVTTPKNGIIEKHIVKMDGFIFIHQVETKLDFRNIGYKFGE